MLKPDNNTRNYQVWSELTQNAKKLTKSDQKY